MVDPSQENEQNPTPPTTEQESEDKIEVPINWHVSDSIITRYATNMLIQSSEEELFLYFFELRPPIIFEAPIEERLRRLREIDELRAECVALIALTPDRAQKLVDLLQTQLARRKATSEATEKE